MKKRVLASLACASLVALGASSADATVVSQTFTATTGCGVSECGTSGGIVTFTDSASDNTLAANQLKITFDNTTVASDVDPGAGTFNNSSLITGIVFNILADINAISSFTFTSGNNVDLTGQWTVGVNINNETTPGNTVFDIAFETTNGVNGGIYNAADPGSSLANAFPDIAVLILTISDPNPYSLASVGGDSILRMQRVGTNGEGSLKIVTTTSSTGSTGSNGGSGGGSGSAPEPGTLSLIGGAILGGLFQYRRRKQARVA